MEISPHDRDRGREMASTMTMGSTSAFPGAEQSLPPLHQAIPEFYSHPSADMPRRIVDRGSPTFQTQKRLSQSPSSAVSDSSSSMPVLSSPSQCRATSAACSIPNIPLAGGRAVSSDLVDTRYDGQNYASPSVDQRRISIISSTSSSYANDSRPSPYLPSVASLTSSRGSSFDMDPSERPQLPVTLPSLFTHTQSLPQNTQQTSSYTSPIDNDMRYQQSPQGYHGYSAGTGVSNGPSYQSSSPGSQYSQYYSHASYSQPQRNPGYASAQQMMMDNRSPFSAGGHPVDMAMDHFDHGRPGKRRRGNLPKHVTDLLRGWLNDHLHHPYPTEDEKQMLMAQTGLNINQVSNWFINARRRRLPSITNTSRIDSDQKSSHSMGSPGPGQ